MRKHQLHNKVVCTWHSFTLSARCGGLLPIQHCQGPSNRGGGFILFRVPSGVRAEGGWAVSPSQICVGCCIGKKSGWSLPQVYLDMREMIQHVPVLGPKLEPRSSAQRPPTPETTDQKGMPSHSLNCWSGSLGRARFQAQS